MENNQDKHIGSSSTLLIILIKTSFSHFRYFLAIGVLVSIVTYLLILPVPRYYRCTVSMVPESSGGMLGGNISSMASVLGFNMGNVNSEDAISPELYPDVLSSNNFVYTILHTMVTTVDGKHSMNYYDYLTKYQKESPLTLPLRWIKTNSDDDKQTSINDLDPQRLSKKDYLLFKDVQKLITCSVERKNDVISITVEDQDPWVCTMLADSVRQHLQEFIIQYRTQKARIDVEHYTKLSLSAKLEYDKSIQKYSEYCESHTEVILQRYVSKRDELEQDMQMKSEVYSYVCKQLELSKAKLQERTPAFTTLTHATMPVKPAGPKRMLISLAMAIVACIVYCGWINRKYLKEFFV